MNHHQSLRFHDVLVLGEGLAGFAAAERLAQRFSTGLLQHPPDSESLADLPVIGPTPWNRKPVTGEEFLSLALDRLKEMGVVVYQSYFPAHVERVSGRWGVREAAPREESRYLESSTLIFSPEGTDPGLPPRLDSERFLGHGLSHSAAADLRFFSNRTVAVYGCGQRAKRAVERARDVANSTHWLCPSHIDARSTPGEGTDVPSMDIEFHEGVELTGLDGNEDGDLRSIELSEAGGRRTIEVSALFLAQDLEPSWELFEEQEGAARHLAVDRSFEVAGLAAGISPEDHAGLFASGVAAARNVHRWLGEPPDTDGS